MFSRFRAALHRTLLLLFRIVLFYSFALESSFPRDKPSCAPPRSLWLSLFPGRVPAYLLNAFSLPTLFRATFTATKTESLARRHHDTTTSYPPCPNISAVYRNFTLRECTSRPLQARFVGDEACLEPSRSTRDFDSTAPCLVVITIFETVQHFNRVLLSLEIKVLDCGRVSMPVIALGRGIGLA